CSGAKTLSADGGRAAALPGAGWAAGLLYRARGLPDGAGAGTAAPALGPPDPGHSVPRALSQRIGVRLPLAWRAASGPDDLRPGSSRLRSPATLVCGFPLRARK